jgi:cell division transport system permease protein
MSALTTALIGMRRSPYQSLAAILLVTLTFFVGYSFSLFSLGSELVLRYFETQPQVIGFFQLNAPNAEIEKIATDMRNKDYVESVMVVSKDQALEQYRLENSRDPLLLELVTAEILPASIEVRGRNVTQLNQIKDDLSQSSTMDEVVYQSDLVKSLSSWTATIRNVGLASSILLVTISFLIIVIIIGMKVASKRPAITIMRIIGATRWYIRLPFLTEGMLYGLIGSVIGWSSMCVALLYLTPWLSDFLGGIKLLPVPWEILAMQLGIGTLAGMILGGFAGTVAVSRMIKH